MPGGPHTLGVVREQPQAPSLSFRDVALERAYQAEASKKTQRAYRTLWILATLAFTLVAFMDRYTAGPVNLPTVLFMRLAIGAPILLGVTISGWTSPATFARARRPATAIGACTVLWWPMALSLCVPDPARIAEPSGPMSMALIIVAMCAWCGIVGAGFLVPVLAIAGHLTLLAFAARRLPAQDSPAIGVWWLWACVLGLVVAWEVEQSKRREFLATRALDVERARSEELLQNVLPATIAERLKGRHDRIADHFDHATVLFGDIVGFTGLSAELTPQDLVAALDDVFSAFDDIADRHGLEKIKTIGDAYMVVGGVPEPRADHADAIAQMALEMRDVLDAKRFAGGRALRMRIGIHSGSVVAGVIGKKKFIYDLWGDTVNTASRMESHGVEGAVQVTESTAELLRERFDLTPRGIVHVKGKGDMKTWLLERRKSDRT